MIGVIVSVHLKATLFLVSNNNCPRQRIKNLRLFIFHKKVTLKISHPLEGSSRLLIEKHYSGSKLPQVYSILSKFSFGIAQYNKYCTIIFNYFPSNKTSRKPCNYLNGLFPFCSSLIFNIAYYMLTTFLKLWIAPKCRQRFVYYFFLVPKIYTSVIEGNKYEIINM